MADRIDDLESFLPSEFWTDEDIRMGTCCGNSSSAAHFSLFSQRGGGPFSSGSPVESVVGSTEPESDEEDSLLAELTCHLTLLDAHRFSSPSHHTHEKAGSPQSTLSHLWSRSGRSPVSSNGSPNGPSQVSSPPTTPSASNNDAWDLIFRAAAKVEGLRVKNAPPFNFSPNSAIFERQKSFPIYPIQPKSALQSSFNYPKHLVPGGAIPGQEGIRRGGQEMKNSWNYERYNFRGNENVGIVNSGLGTASIPWPNNLRLGHMSLPQHGSGPGAVGPQQERGYGYGVGFGSVGLKSERVGTGVFLPRRYGDNGGNNFPSNSSDSRKKPAFVRPKKVPVVTKDLRVKTAYSQCQAGGGEKINNYDAMLAQRASLLPLQTTTSLPEGAINHDICLPQEWTY